MRGDMAGDLARLSRVGPQPTETREPRTVNQCARSAPISANLRPKPFSVTSLLSVAHSLHFAKSVVRYLCAFAP